MHDLPELKKITKLEAEIDFRIADLWDGIDGCELTLRFVGALMRAAYGRGYVDALTEPKRGMLCSEYGYRVPRPHAKPDLNAEE